MPGSKRRWGFAIAIALYLYLLLPATAVLFYELYHLTGLGFIYRGFQAFKVAGYYFGAWEYQAVACSLVAAFVVVVPILYSKAAQQLGK